MEVKRTCDHCKHCRDRGGYYWCRQFKIEVFEDDYCSFGGDLQPEHDDEDKAYEQAKEKRLEGWM